MAVDTARASKATRVTRPSSPIVTRRYRRERGPSPWRVVVLTGSTVGGTTDSRAAARGVVCRIPGRPVVSRAASRPLAGQGPHGHRAVAVQGPVWEPRGFPRTGSFDSAEGWT